MSLTHVGRGEGAVFVAPGAIAVVAGAGPSAAVLSAVTAADDRAAVVAALGDAADAAALHCGADEVGVAAIGSGRVRLAVGGEEIVVEGRGHRWTFDVVHPDAAIVRLDTAAGADAGRADVETMLVTAGAVRGGWAQRSLAAGAVVEADPYDALFGDTVERSIAGAGVGADDARRARAVVLVGSDGRRIVVDRPVLIGRNPDFRDDTEHRGRLVRVAAADVSRRHALVRPGEWTATIEDLGSSNGTTVIGPGDVAESVEPGRSHPLTAGSTLAIGAVTFSVEVTA